MGFDLTYSLIRERNQAGREYLVGMFGGVSESKRISIFGVVITNSQSVEVYKFIFSEFLTMVGSHPHSFVTDEEKNIFYALKELRD